MKKKIYEIIRKSLAKKATGNLGRIVIHDDIIFCYVDGKKLKKKEKYTHRYNLIFKCIPLKEDIYKIYNLEKPVHYIIEDVDFDREINIKASVTNCHVTFKNCTFTGAVEIDFADVVTFINNTYKAQNYSNFRSIYKEGEFGISTRTNKNEINKIEFIGDDIDVDYPETIPVYKVDAKSPKKKQEKSPIVEIWLYAKEILIRDTDIVDAKKIEVVTDDLILNKVNISSKEIEVVTDDLILNKVNISSEEIEVDAANLDSVNLYNEIKGDIISVNTNSYFGELSTKYKTLFVNGIEANKNESNINEETLKLQKQRLELLSTLKKIETCTEEQISQKLKKEPLTKVLKR